jgi:hypothetical protein
MEHVFLYNLNAYTYGDPSWFAEMLPELRDEYKDYTTFRKSVDS